MILPGTGRGTAPAGRGGGGATLRKPEVYAARRLRRAMTPLEVRLWEQVRGCRLGFKVRRQHPVGPYIADFYVVQARLIVEVDGEVHNRGSQPRRDFARDAYFERHGYTVLRLAASDVMRNLDGVLEAIRGAAESPLHHPADGPPPRAGEDCA